tara:strand:- start:245 stop:454 length:210 start_codon:yes stop_codon:yes gene_type:complete
MDLNILDTTKISKEKIKKHVTNDRKVFYTMDIIIFNTQLDKNAKKIEVKNTIVLFSDTKESLKIKSEIL